MTPEISYSLQALKSQWRETKSPKLGLQLAEEHRKREDLDAAVEVLKAGLEAHPEHMSSRVALSRYLVDAGRFEEALGHLDRIVGVDPVHLVANKLLVRTHIGLGRLEEARDKLDIYEMLGEGDADIETLRQAVSGSPSPPSDEADRGGASVPEALEAAPETGAPEPASSADLFAADAPSGGVGDETQPIPVLGPGEPEEPFGAVWTRDASAGFWDEVGEEGIFAVAQTQMPAGEPSSAPPPPVAAGAPEEPGAAAEPFAAPADDGPPAEEPEAEPSGEPRSDGMRESTVTLGDLYREQGHTAEAAETYRQVLERDPGNPAARERLQALKEAAPAAATVVERKRAVLVEYRDRLRRAEGAPA